MKYGMSSTLGLVNYEESSDEIFIGRDLGHTKNFSEKIAAQIDEEVRKIIDECHERAQTLISEHRYVLDECAKQLIEKEKLNRTEFEALFVEEEQHAGA